MGDARPLELTPFEEEARAEEDRAGAREILRAALDEAAQNAIVDEVLRLEEAGEVAIEGRGGEAVVM